LIRPDRRASALCRQLHHVSGHDSLIGATILAHSASATPNLTYFSEMGSDDNNTNRCTGELFGKDGLVES
jgi:hypothetical protein